MSYSFGVVGKFWRIFMKRGSSAYIYGVLSSVFFFFKKVFRIRIFLKILKKYSIYEFSDSSITFLLNYNGYWYFNPNFIFFFLLEHGKPALILSSRLVRGDVKRIPFFFNIDIRAYAKIFRWLKEIIKVKNSLFFLLPQRLFLELVNLYKNTSSVLSLKANIHQDLLTTRPNLKFLHKI